MSLLEKNDLLARIVEKGSLGSGVLASGIRLQLVSWSATQSDYKEFPAEFLGVLDKWERVSDEDGDVLRDFFDTTVVRELD